jgi:hypothetical protein
MEKIIGKLGKAPAFNLNKDIYDWYPIYGPSQTYTNALLPISIFPFLIGITIGNVATECPRAKNYRMIRCFIVP